MVLLLSSFQKEGKRSRATWKDGKLSSTSKMETRKLRNSNLKFKIFEFKWTQHRLAFIQSTEATTLGIQNHFFVIDYGIFRDDLLGDEGRSLWR